MCVTTPRHELARDMQGTVRDGQGQLGIARNSLGHLERNRVSQRQPWGVRGNQGQERTASQCQGKLGAPTSAFPLPFTLLFSSSFSSYYYYYSELSAIFLLCSLVVFSGRFRDSLPPRLSSSSTLSFYYDNDDDVNEDNEDDQGGEDD